MTEESTEKSYKKYCYQNFFLRQHKVFLRNEWLYKINSLRLLIQLYKKWKYEKFMSKQHLGIRTGMILSSGSLEEHKNELMKWNVCLFFQEWMCYSSVSLFCLTYSRFLLLVCWRIQEKHSFWLINKISNTFTVTAQQKIN